jgi:hypothetical protein
MVQVAECLTNKVDTLTSTPVLQKKKKKKVEIEGQDRLKDFLKHEREHFPRWN